jgi:hypothetical protein
MGLPEKILLICSALLGLRVESMRFVRFRFVRNHLIPEKKIWLVAPSPVLTAILQKNKIARKDKNMKKLDFFPIHPVIKSMIFYLSMFLILHVIAIASGYGDLGIDSDGEKRWVKLFGAETSEWWQMILWVIIGAALFDVGTVVNQREREFREKIFRPLYFREGAGLGVLTGTVFGTAFILDGLTALPFGLFGGVALGISFGLFAGIAFEIFSFLYRFFQRTKENPPKGG